MIANDDIFITADLPMNLQARFFFSFWPQTDYHSTDINMFWGQVVGIKAMLCEISNQCPCLCHNVFLFVLCGKRLGKNILDNSYPRDTEWLFLLSVYIFENCRALLFCCLCLFGIPFTFIRFCFIDNLY